MENVASFSDLMGFNGDLLVISWKYPLVNCPITME